MCDYEPVTYEYNTPNGTKITSKNFVDFRNMIIHYHKDDGMPINEIVYECDNLHGFGGKVIAYIQEEEEECYSSDEEDDE